MYSVRKKIARRRHTVAKKKMLNERKVSKNYTKSTKFLEKLDRRILYGFRIYMRLSIPSGNEIVTPVLLVVVFYFPSRTVHSDTFMFATLAGRTRSTVRSILAFFFATYVKATVQGQL
jgi:hypothetical protein